MTSMSFLSAHTILPIIHARGVLENSEENSVQSAERSSAELHPYNFRSLKYFPSIHAAFVDDLDPTDDFDPDKADDLQENVYLPKSLHYHPRPYHVLGPPREPKEKVTTWQTGRRQGLLGRIALKLGDISEASRYSERGRKVFTLLSCWTNNWPVTEILDDEENSTELQLESICEERLRQRSDTQRSLVAEYGDNKAFEWKEVTLGHPAARGCKACYELGIDCALISGECYPCSTCEEDGNSCELIMEPKKKRACEGCTKRRVVCSFRTQDNHQGPCKACTDKGITCIAGPKSGFTREGPSLDCPPLPAEQSTKVRKHLQGDGEGSAESSASTSDRPAKRLRRMKCAQCKGRKTYCSLIANPKASSCARCRKRGLTCVPGNNDIGSPFVKATTPPPEVEFVSSRVRQPRYAVYEGKIQFNYCGALPCNWCNCESHGFFGPAQNSEYLQAALQVGRIDTQKSQRLPSSSRMCFDCSMARFEIIGCLRHQLCKLESAPPDEANDDEEDFVLPGIASLAPWTWCMVCPRVARFRCCRVRRGMVDGERETCRLRLCRDCACSLTLDHGGDLNELIRQAEAEWQTELDLRADANFLRNDGYLVCSQLGSQPGLQCDRLEHTGPYLM